MLKYMLHYMFDDMDVLFIVPYQLVGRIVIFVHQHSELPGFGLDLETGWQWNVWVAQQRRSNVLNPKMDDDCNNQYPLVN